MPAAGPMPAESSWMYSKPRANTRRKKPNPDMLNKPSISSANYTVLNTKPMTRNYYPNNGVTSEKKKPGLFLMNFTNG